MTPLDQQLRDVHDQVDTAVSDLEDVEYQAGEAESTARNTRKDLEQVRAQLATLESDTISTVETMKARIDELEGDAANAKDEIARLEQEARAAAKTAAGPPQTARQVLDVIDEFLARDRSAYYYSDEDQKLVLEQKKLWAILTALRGPDSKDPFSGPSSETKTASTAVIRSKAFPKTAAKTWRYAQFAQPDQLGDLSMVAPEFRGHFFGHAMEAFRALDLPLGPYVDEYPDDDPQDDDDDQDDQF